MGFTKFNRAESAKPLSKQAHVELEEELEKEGVTSMEDLSKDARKRVSKILDSNS